jgi:hypothetical protein
LAQTTKLPVLFTPAEIPLEVVEPVKSVNEPVVAELKRAPIMAVQPTGEEVQLAQVVTPPPPQELEPTVMAQTSLPATASPVPLIGLLGLLALGGAFAVRATANRMR